MLGTKIYITHQTKKQDTLGLPGQNQQSRKMLSAIRHSWHYYMVAPAARLDSHIMKSNTNEAKLSSEYTDANTVFIVSTTALKSHI